MKELRLLDGKICLITGSSRGIGRAIAEKYAEHGAIVYANARDIGEIDSWANECSEKFGTSVVPLYFDITDYTAVKQAILDIKKAHRRIDVLVNNAGIVSYELLGMIDLNKLREMFETNVIAMIELIQLTSRIMSRQESGSIINISSIVGDKGVAGQLGYAATKGAVIALTKSAAKELSSKNIRINAIAPGLVDTERFSAVFEEKFSHRLANIGMGRLAKPVEIANASVFFGSDLSEYVTGQVLGVDGGTII